MGNRISDEELAKYVGRKLNSPTARKLRSALLAERNHAKHLRSVLDGERCMRLGHEASMDLKDAEIERLKGELEKL